MDVRSEARWTEVAERHDRAVHHLESVALGDTLEITIVPPPADLPVAATAPALYVLDPFLTLDTVAGWSRVYGRYSEGVLPPAVVVGVGHPGNDERQFMARRIRDLTPTPVTGREWKPPLGAGQGPKLLDALAHEIVPFVEARHPTGGDRTVIGWSLGGLFVLTALFRRPGLFARYLAVSPSLWWENGLPLVWEKEWAAAHDDLAARVFLAVGSREQAPGGGWKSEGFSDEIIAWFRQVSNFRTFTRRLKERHYPSLRLDSHVFRDEYHMTVYPAAVARGLVKLFEQ